MSGSELVSLIFGFLVVSAIAFVAIALAASFLRFQGMADDATKEGGPGQVGRNGWNAALAARLSMVPSAPAPFAVLLFAPRDPAGREGEADAEAEALLQGLRKSDRIFLLEGHRIGVLLGAPRGTLSAVLGRLRAVPPMNDPAWAVGMATYPEDGTRLDPLLQAAEEALARALEQSDAPYALAGGEPLPAVAEDHAEPPPTSELVDALTGALKPDRFLSSLQKLASAARREGQSLSLLVVRIEHLARYREHYGAEAADTLLAALGRVLRAGVRENDLPVRIDEEQMGVMVHCQGEEALAVAQRLCEQVRSQPVPYADSELKMSINVGIATAPADAHTGRDLFAYAESAANEAASQGRGACVRFDPERMTPGEAEEEVEPQAY